MMFHPLSLHDLLTKRNHKGFSIDHFHCFLNKSVIITIAEYGINDIFVPASIAAAYAWNSVPIYGTDIIRVVPVIGRALHFALDINFNAVQKLIHNNAHAILNYLHFTNSHHHFPSSILKILIEDQRTAHAERINNSKTLLF